MNNASGTPRRARVPLASLVGPSATAPFLRFAVAIAFFGVFLESLSPMQPSVQPVAHNVDCVAGARDSASAGTGMNTLDQAGRRWELHAQKGRLFIVSFLAVVPDKANTPSRAQAVSIQSMQTQYGQLGVSALVIDETKLNRGSGSSENERLNAWYDWHLDPIPLLADVDSSIARSFNVCSAPTTVLLGSKGRVLKRWDSIVNAGELAQEIQAILLASQSKARQSKPTSPLHLPSKLKLRPNAFVQCLHGKSSYLRATIHSNRLIERDSICTDISGHAIRPHGVLCGD